MARFIFYVKILTMLLNDFHRFIIKISDILSHADNANGSCCLSCGKHFRCVPGTTPLQFSGKLDVGACTTQVMKRIDRLNLIQSLLMLFIELFLDKEIIAMGA